MSDLKGLRLVVAGAGAIGSVLALQLARGGAQVVLADPAAAGDNASGVAAGMLAPLFEALLDPLATPLYPLLLHARDGWSDVLPVGLIDRSGALFGAQSADAARRFAERAASLGGQAEPIDDARATIMVPGLQPHGGWVFTTEDWRLDPRAALTALHAAFADHGGRRLAVAALTFKDGFVGLGDGSSLPADGLILATGLGTDSRLSPIKGQILRFPGLGPVTGPVVRAPGVYVVPSQGGLIVGATMEEGVGDRSIDPAAVAALRAAAATLFPHLAEARAVAYAGVRAATVDGAPLVGAGEQPGVWLAQGARRNGWLLAPLIAEVLIDRLLGSPPSSAASAFDPARFG